MKLTVHIDSDNEHMRTRHDAQRALDRVRLAIADGKTGGKILDAANMPVGRWSLTGARVD